MAESGSLDKSDSENLIIFNKDILLENEVVGNLILGLSTKNTIERLESQKFAILKREALIILLIAFGEFIAGFH